MGYYQIIMNMSQNAFCVENKALGDVAAQHFRFSSAEFDQNIFDDLGLLSLLGFQLASVLSF